jgi:hypothetical protein
MSSPIKPQSVDTTTSDGGLGKAIADAEVYLSGHKTPETEHGQLTDSMRSAKAQYMNARENLQTIRDSGSRDADAIKSAVENESKTHDKMYDANNAYRRAKGIPEINNPRKIESNY